MIITFDTPTSDAIRRALIGATIVANGHEIAHVTATGYQPHPREYVAFLVEANVDFANQVADAMIEALKPLAEETKKRYAELGIASEAT